ncbi:MAG: FGGY-family carbohydrate kinase, partial [Candidatus Neomarinimicrobiota bacterium]
GGARSPLWRRIMAHVFQVEVIRVENEEQAALGAALLAGIGVGLYAGADEACARAVRYGEAALPGEEEVKRYEECYERYRRLYPTLKGEFHGLANADH